jgi:nucleotide-binding universal stress UspA family protein
MFDKYPPKSVIVGIDGSQAAIRAARWAVDEVAGTDIPLRLFHVINTNPSTDPDKARVELVAAEELVRVACRAVDESGKPLKLETEIIHGQPVPVLLAASCSTTLLCIGDKGLAQHPNAWLGSTAKELAASAHCSVAIIRGQGDKSGSTAAGCIVACADETPEDLDVLDLAVNEAVRRQAALRVVTTAHTRSHDVEPDRRECIPLDITLKRLASDHPGVEIETIDLNGSFLDYLAAYAASIQLIMVGSARTPDMQQLLGDVGERALRRSDCSLLIVGLERLGCS